MNNLYFCQYVKLFEEVRMGRYYIYLPLDFKIIGNGKSCPSYCEAYKKKCRMDLFKKAWQIEFQPVLNYNLSRAAYVEGLTKNMHKQMVHIIAVYAAYKGPVSITNDHINDTSPPH